MSRPLRPRFLRFLLLLPGGDRVEGLRDMLFAREHGALLRGEADYQLHWVYLWYEEQPQRGLAVAAARCTPATRATRSSSSASRRSSSSTFHDPSASLATWQELLAAADAGTRPRGAARGGARAPRVGRAARRAL